MQRTFEASGAFASWSPDAAWLAYQCARGGDIQMCVVDAAATAPARQLTHDAGTNFIGEWIDDEAILVAGKRVAYGTSSASRDQRGGVTLTAFTEPRFYVRYPRWDSDRPPGRLRALRDDRPAVGGAAAALIAAGSPGSAPWRRT